MCFFFFNDTATTEIYTYVHTLSLHDALPISKQIALAEWLRALFAHVAGGHIGEGGARENIDRIDRRTRMMTANRAPFEVGKPSRLLPIEVGHSKIGRAHV